MPAIVLWRGKVKSEILEEGGGVSGVFTGRHVSHAVVYPRNVIHDWWCGLKLLEAQGKGFETAIRFWICRIAEFCCPRHRLGVVGSHCHGPVSKMVWRDCLFEHNPMKKDSQQFEEANREFSLGSSCSFSAGNNTHR
jgi:hypothetical protein